jgi:hypothetical protein
MCLAHQLLKQDTLCFPFDPSFSLLLLLLLLAAAAAAAVCRAFALYHASCLASQLVKMIHFPHAKSLFSAPSGSRLLILMLCAGSLMQ